MRLTDKTKIITNLEEEIQGLRDQITALENDKAMNEQKKMSATRSKKTIRDNVADREASIENSDKKKMEPKLEKKVESKDDREKKTAKSEKEKEIERINEKIAEEEKKKVRVPIRDRVAFILCFIIQFLRTGNFCALQLHARIHEVKHVTLLPKPPSINKTFPFISLSQRKEKKWQLGRFRRIIETTV